MSSIYGQARLPASESPCEATEDKQCWTLPGSRPHGQTQIFPHAGKSKIKFLLLCTIEHSGKWHVRRKEIRVQHLARQAPQGAASRSIGRTVRSRRFRGAGPPAGKPPAAHEPADTHRGRGAQVPRGLGRRSLVLLHIRGRKPAHPAVDLSPPPAVRTHLRVNLHHVSLEQGQFSHVSGTEVIPSDGDAQHFRT